MHSRRTYLAAAVAGVGAAIAPQAEASPRPTHPRAEFFVGDFATVADLVAAPLSQGDHVTVQGYYAANDGGAHERIIDDADDGSGVQLDNGLWANVLYDGGVRVKAFGVKGDGVYDDTTAFHRALDFAFAKKTTYEIFAEDVLHSGNVIVDLQGSEVVLNRGYRRTQGAGVTICDGLLSAGADFDPTETSFLLDFAGGGRRAFQYVTVTNTLINGNHHANCLRFDNYTRINLERLTIVRFIDYGISLERSLASHEALVDNILIGYKEWGDPERDPELYTGIGLNVAANDNIINNVVVFAARQGIVVTRPYNILSNLHVWGSPGGNVVNDTSFCKYSHVYSDGHFTELRKASNIHLTDFMFLNSYLKIAPQEPEPGALLPVQNLSLSHSSFHGPRGLAPDAVVVDDPNNWIDPDTWTNVRLDGNSFAFMPRGGMYTELATTTAVTGQSQSTVDFSEPLRLRPHITDVSVTFSNGDYQTTPVLTSTHVDGARVHVAFFTASGEPATVTGTLFIRVSTVKEPIPAEVAQ